MDTEQLKLSSTILLANQANQTSNNYFNIVMTMLLSTLLTSIINYISTIVNGRYIIDYIKYFLEKINIRKKEYKIILSSRTLYSRYMVRCNDITEQKLAVLYYIRKNMNNYNDLYKLKQDYIKKNLDIIGCESSKTKTENFYLIDQTNEIIIERNNEFYIKIKTNNILENFDEKNKSNIKIDELILITNKSLLYLKEFIDKCVKLKKKDDSNDKEQYIYTYIGEDDENNIMLRIDKFVPYTNFNTLVGKNIKIIEDCFDFFVSDEGKKWYRERGIPYQLTHLYYGEPGSGKSIIASAIVNKFNLHIVKIKLSEIKSNKEFCRILKNRKFGNKIIDYDKILYFFDEIDIELEHIINRTKMKNINQNQPIILNTEKRVNCNLKLNDELSIGTILEELNGINQMYGRKMVIITNNYNKLLNIHNGALVRPGRIDLKLEFNKLLKDDAIEMIKIFFPNEFNENILNYIQNNTYTPATLSNLCKISKNMKELIYNLESVK